MVKRQDGVKRIKKGMRIRREDEKGMLAREKMSQIVHICKWTIHCAADFAIEVNEEVPCC